MANDNIISKLLLGNDEIETVTIDNGKGEKVEVELRPLTSGELSILQKMEKAPYTMQMKINKNGERVPVNREDMINNEENTMDISMGEFTESKSKIMYLAVAYSMDITTKQVEGFHTGVPEQIFKEVIRISNITEDDLDSLKQFRNNK